MAAGTSIETFDAARSQAIEARNLTSGVINGDGNLNLQSYDGAIINAGLVRGEKGDTGPVGPDAPSATESVAGTLRYAAASDLADLSSDDVGITPSALLTGAMVLAMRPPICKVRLGTSPAITAASDATAVVPFDTVIFDDHGIYNTTTHQFTVPYSGFYRISGRLRQTTAVAFQLRPTTPSQTLTYAVGSWSGESALAAAGGTSYYEGIHQCNANDTFVFINASAAITASGSTASDFVWGQVEYLRPLP